MKRATKQVRNSPLLPSLCLVIESVNSRGQLECINTQCSISQSSERHALLYIPGLSCSSLHSSPLWQTDRQTDGHTIESTDRDQHQLYRNITEHKDWKKWSNKRNVIRADSTTTTSVELSTCIIFQYLFCFLLTPTDRLYAILYLCYTKSTQQCAVVVMAQRKCFKECSHW